MTANTDVRRVLILCTGNSCRSQMAEALWNSLAGGSWRADSAGSKPSGYVHPLAIRAMAEFSIDVAQNRSKSVDEFAGQPFDLVVTVCDNAREACPYFPGAASIEHWPFPDPADAHGEEHERMTVFRRVRDDIRARIAQFLKQPVT